MEHNQKKNWLEHGKTALIFCLALSAAYLLTRTSLVGAAGHHNWLSPLFPAQAQPVDSTVPDRRGGMIRPVRLAVMNEKPGRYGIQYDQETVDAKFGDMANLLSDALAAAGKPTRISAQRWQELLTADSPALYLDLLGTVPCADLPGWMGGRAQNPALIGTARRLILSKSDSGGVLLAYQNGVDGNYYAADTAAGLAGRLSVTAEAFDPNGATFAFENPAQYSRLSPDTLILAEPKNPKIYTADNPVPWGSEPLDHLIRALKFHPQNAIVLDDLTLREGSDTLRVSSGGVVSYYSPGADPPRFPVSADGKEPTRAEMVACAWTLLEKAVLPRCGAARLYLVGIETEAEGTAIYFAYQLNGASVHVGADGYAARFLVQNDRISAFTLQLRQYADSLATSALLPERQAAAAMEALGADGSELLMYYLDRQEDLVQAGWVAK